MNFDYSNINFKHDGKLKLLIIVGTRPEIIRLSSVITKCRKYFDCILAHTGQNYDYNLHGIFFNTCKEYTQWILYYPKNPILVLLWGLALCLFVSVIIMFPIDFIVKIKNKLFFK